MTGETHEHDLGLQHDLPRIWGRRRLFGLAGGIGVSALAGCTTEEGGTTSGTPSSGAPDVPPPGGAAPGGGVDVADGEIPEETAGPYPGDGSNGPDVLSESGVVRSDLTRSFGAASGVAEGVPTTVRLRVLDMNGDEVGPMAGAAVYLWHCDREGRYSLYSEGVTEENFLRGVQEAGEDGWLEFTTIFPACYQGRWPHMHFEVYESLAKATSAENKLRTSQLAIPAGTCAEVYGVAEGYDASVDTFAGVGLDSDMVFADGYSLQLAKVAGSVEEGYTLTLNVPV